MKMTRSTVVVATLAINLAVIVSGCGGDDGSADTTTTIAPTTTLAPSTTTTLAGPVDWSEAGDYVGEEVTITGTVASCDCEDSIQRVYLPLGGDDSDVVFDIWIDLNADGSVPFAGITSPELPGLVGKTVEITGTVVDAGDSSCGIFLADMSQLVVK